MKGGIPALLRSARFAGFSSYARAALASSLFCLAGGLGLVAGPQQLVIHWKSSTVSSATDLFKDRDGGLLQRGLPANGDGYLVTLGYFTQANASGTDADLFKGDWVPLTSGTAVGDSSSGYGYGNGMFSFTTVFTIGTDDVQVYPYEPAGYVVKAPQVVTASLPPPNHPIAIRFYDRTVADASAKYNTVSNREWKWPTVSSNIPENLYLKASNTTPPSSSKWKYGSIFEDPSKPFQANLGVQVTLGVTAGPGGTVTDVNGTYNYGQSVAIQATPNPNKEFVSWIGAGVAEPTFSSTTVSMTNPRTLQATFRDAHYDVTLTTSGGNGTLTGAGSYPIGSTPTVTATPATGYEFAGWQGVGLADANASSTTTGALSGDVAYVAVFRPKGYSIEANATAGGNVSLQPGPYLFASQYDLNATPWRGHNFSGWTSETNSTATLSSTTDTNVTLTPTGNAKFTANFTQQSYNLNVSTVKGGTVSPTSQGPYAFSQQVPVSATPSTGYLFSHWTGDLASLANALSASTDANMSVKAADVTLQAHFAAKTYAVEINASTGGSATLAAGPYEHFGVYALTAAPQAGYTFTGWQGDAASLQGVVDSTATSTHLAVSGPAQLTATFSLGNFNLSVTSGTGGSVQGGGTFRADHVATITATPSVGYQFSNWSGDVGALNDASAASTTVSMSALSKNLQLAANFTRKTYQVTAAVNGAGDVNGSQSLSLTHSHFDSASFRANPAAGWHFDRWSWTGPANLPNVNSAATSFSVAGSTALTAHFARNSHHLAVAQATRGDTNGSGSYLYDANVTIKATPHYGYAFTNWTGNTAALSNPNAATTIARMPDHNVSFTPNFSPLNFTATTNVTGNGTLAGGGSFAYGTSVTLTATPDGIGSGAPRGNQLKKIEWTSSRGSGSTTDNPFTLTLEADTTITATFEPIPGASLSLTILKNPSGGGSTLGAGHLNEDLDHPVSATPSDDHTFLGWTAEGPLVFRSDDGNASASVHLDGNATLTAHFAAKTRKLSISSGTGGSATGGGTTFSHGHHASIVATPSANYDFAGWTVDKNTSYVVSLGSRSIASSKPVFLLDGRERPALTLVRGHTYLFNVSTNANYPFYLSSRPDASASYAGEYLSGVTGSRATSGTLSFTVPSDAPDLLYYHSPNATSMGSPLRIVTLSDSAIVSQATSASTSIPLTADFSLKANFALKKYNLAVTSTTGGSLATDPSGSYDHGTILTLTANAPEEHFTFTGWQGAGGSTPNSLSTTLTMDGPKSVTATYAPRKYKLTINKNPSHSGDARTSTNETEFPHNTTVSLVATSKLGHNFINWTGATVTDSLASTTTIVVKDDVSVTANFQPGVFNLVVDRQTLNPNGSLHADPTAGGLVVAGSSYAYGVTTPVRAIPNAGYEFVEWKSNKTITYDVSTSAQGAYQLKEQSRPALVLARGYVYNFKLDGSSTSGKRFHFSLTPDGLNAGGAAYVTGVSGSLSDTGTITFSPDENTPALLYYAAQGHAGYGNEIRIIDASAADTGLLQTAEASTSVGIFTDKSLTAVFRRQTHSITHASVPTAGGSIALQGENPATHGSTVTLTATPSTGYRFQSWSGDGLSSSEKASSSLTLAVTEKRNLIARFVQIGEITLTLNISPAEAGWVSGAGRYGYNSAHPISAGAKQGYRFVSWQGDGVTDANASATTIDLASDRSITALFEKIPSATQYSLSIAISPAAGGRATGAGTHTSTTSHAISAVANTGYRFLSWQGEGVANEKHPTTTVDLSSHRSLTALFEKLSSAPDPLADALAQFDPIVYLALNPTLKTSLANDLDAARNHFVNTGFSQNLAYRTGGQTGGTGQPATPPSTQPNTLQGALKVFDPVTYLALNPDLASHFGSNLAQAKNHFIEHGFAAGRAFVPASFDPSTTVTPAHGFTSLDHALQAFTPATYLALNPQISNILGSANHTGAKEHFIQYGYALGLAFSTTTASQTPQPNPSDSSLGSALVTFDPVTYLNLNPSIAGSLGNDLDAATEYFIRTGHALGDKFTDSSTATTGNKLPTTLTLDQALQSFDPISYLDANPDLTTVLDGDLNAAEQHFIEHGHGQGREFRPTTQRDANATPALPKRTLEQAVKDFDPDLYLALNPDLKASIGSKPEELKTHYVKWGHAAGRPTQPEDVPSSTGSGTQPSTPGLLSLTLSVFPDAAGSVNGAGSFAQGSTRSIEASPGPGYVFQEWRGEGVESTSSAKTTVTLDANRTLYAIFHYVGTGLPPARIPGSTYVGWSWWNSSWFGTHWRQDGVQWIHHDVLGWMYLVPHSEDSIWFWSEILEGWHWTNKSLYPFLYDYKTSTWLWFNKDGSNSSARLFFRYQTGNSNGTWESK